MNLSKLTFATLALALSLLTSPAIAAEGDLDASFAQPFFTGWDISSLVRQPDGKIVVSGDFTQVNGVTRSCIARFNADGTLDTGFDPGLGFDSPPSKILLQSDGKILCVGGFFSFNGTQRVGLARLNANGSLDASFDPAAALTLNGSPTPNDGSASVFDADLRTDGLIVIVGQFDKSGFTTVNHVARLLADGSLDPIFYAGAISLGGSIPSASISQVRVLGDNRVFLNGNFDTLAGNVTPIGIARVGTDGVYDASYNLGTGPAPATATGQGVLAVDPAGVMYYAGEYTSWNGVPTTGLTRLDATGAVDTSFNANITPGASVNGLGFSYGASAPDGGLFICGNIHSLGGQTRQGIIKLTSSGALDPAFDSSVGLGQAGVGSKVIGLAGGGALVGGRFSTAGGLSRYGVALFAANGAVDPTFTPAPGVFRGGPTETVAVTAVQISTGKTWVGGLINAAGSTPRYGLSRLNADGTLDATFLAGSNQGPDFSVRSIIFQADGKVLIGGGFLYYNGVSRRRIARLNADGTLDASFDPGLGFDNRVNQLKLNPDGTIYAIGLFGTFNGSAHSGIVRLTANGALDPSFNPGTALPNGSTLSAIAVQSDGRIVLGGIFTTWNGVANKNIVRLLPTGAIDSTFAVGALGASSTVSALYAQPDDKLLVGGFFSQLAGVTRLRYGRLLSTGALDTSFVPPTAGVGGVVRTIFVGLNGTTYLGGNVSFSNVNGVSGVTRRTVVRITPTGAVDATFNVGLGAQTEAFGQASPIITGTVQSISLGVGASTLNVGGAFTTFGGAPKGMLARVLVNAPSGPNGAFLNANFTPAELSDPLIAGDTADPDHDGIPNLAEYAFALNPRTNGASGLPTVAVVLSGGFYANEITFTRLVPATDISYIVETSGDSITWVNNNTTLVNTVPQGATERVTFRDNTNSSSAPSVRFIRVRVTKP